MAFKETIASLWQNFVLFGQAFDHDAQSEMAQEIARLIAARNGDQKAIAAVMSRLDALAAEVRDLSERAGHAG